MQPRQQSYHSTHISDTHHNSLITHIYIWMIFISKGNTANTGFCERAGVISLFCKILNKPPLIWDFELIMAQSRYKATSIWVNTGSASGLLPDGTKSPSESILTCHQCGPVAFIQGRFHKKYTNHQSVKYAWTVIVWNFCQISQGPMCYTSLYTRLASPKRPLHPYCTKRHTDICISQESCTHTHILQGHMLSTGAIVRLSHHRPSHHERAISRTDFKWYTLH